MSDSEVHWFRASSVTPSSIPIGARDDSMEDMEATIAWGEAEVARLKAALEAAEAENERLRVLLESALFGRYAIGEKDDTEH